MDLRLEGKVAFVGGSSRGIGRGIARSFLAEGARVVVTGRQKGPLAQTVAALEDEFGRDRVLACCGDLSQPEDISRSILQTNERWGGVDCLVANIGSGTAKAGWQLSSGDWEKAFDANLWSSVRLVDMIAPAMLQRRCGSITLIASIVGLESVDAPLPYGAAKAALVSYGKNLSRELGQHGVRVNCVAPGNILFPGGTWERKLAQDPAYFERHIGPEVALRRLGTPEEVADLVVFLASERAAFVTGACFVVDGGQTRGSFL